MSEESKVHTEPPPPEIQEALESAEKKLSEAEAKKDAAGPLKDRMPLFFCDSRFSLLRKTLISEFQKKFVKLFKKVPKDQGYMVNQEICAWLASFVFENLRAMNEAWHSGPRDAELFLHVFNLFIANSELKPAAPPDAQDPAAPPSAESDKGVEAAGSQPTQGTVDSAPPLGAATPAVPCCGATPESIEPAPSTGL